ncbi:MAG: hypothetical protein AAGE88_24680, partial [Actinomycetota bacterium]
MRSTADKANSGKDLGPLQASAPEITLADLFSAVTADVGDDPSAPASGGGDGEGQGRASDDGGDPDSPSGDDEPDKRRARVAKPGGPAPAVSTAAWARANPDRPRSPRGERTTGFGGSALPGRRRRPAAATLTLPGLAASAEAQTTADTAARGATTAGGATAADAGAKPSSGAGKRPANRAGRSAGAASSSPAARRRAVASARPPSVLGEGDPFGPEWTSPRTLLNPDRLTRGGALAALGLAAAVTGVVAFGPTRTQVETAASDSAVATAAAGAAAPEADATGDDLLRGGADSSTPDALTRQSGAAGAGESTTSSSEAMPESSAGSEASTTSSEGPTSIKLSLRSGLASSCILAPPAASQPR